MKRVLIVVVTLFIVSSIFSQKLEFQNESVATPNEFNSALVNPAGLSFQDNSSLTYMVNFDTYKKINKPFALIFKTEGFSYIYDDQSKDGSYQTLATGFRLGKGEISNNLYYGFGYTWRSGSFNNYYMNNSLLYRPSNHFSFGYVLNHDKHMHPDHRFGVAIRPFASNMIELTCDQTYGTSFDESSAKTDREFLKPTVGMNANICRYVSLGGSYNFEDEEVYVKFSLSNLGTLIGSYYNTKQKNYHVDNGYTYISLNDKLFNRGIFSEKKFVDMQIDGNVVDVNKSMSLGFIKLSLSDNTTTKALLDKIHQATSDDEIMGMLFKNCNFGSSMAKRQEILTAMQEFKATGKKVVFYYENCGNANYAFAANIADAIYINPEGMVNLRGIGGLKPYIKTLLDTLDIDYYNFRSHPYKTAGNMFSEKGMTQPERMVLERCFSDLYEEFCKLISDGRGDKLTDNVKNIIDNGPYFNAADALECGMIDDLVEAHELDQRLKDEFGTSEIIETSNEYYADNWYNEGSKKVALIYAQGNIIDGEGQTGKNIGSVTTAKAIRLAREDESVEGIILRVDSGGGSALASHIIAEEVRLCAEENKPVIALMSSVAASGGYYISCWADQIIAEPTTITGSIGVIGMIPNFARFSKKLGVNWSEYKFGKNSTFLSLFKEMTPEEKQLMQEYIAVNYRSFVNTVAKAREKSYEEIDAIAKGQIWTGNQGLEIGLVDKLGGFETAISEMEQKLDSKIRLVNYSDAGKSALYVNVNFKPGSVVGNFLNNSLFDVISQINDLVKNDKMRVKYQMPFEEEMSLQDLK